MIPTITSSLLTHSMPLVFLYTPWKHQKTSDLMMILGVQKEVGGMKWVKTYC